MQTLNHANMQSYRYGIMQSCKHACKVSKFSSTSELKQLSIQEPREPGTEGALLADITCTLSFCRTPEQCPHVVSLLSESFNAHVRCGSAMALGISCAGTGNKVHVRVSVCLLLVSDITQWLWVWPSWLWSCSKRHQKFDILKMPRIP